MKKFVRFIFLAFLIVPSISAIIDPQEFANGETLQEYNIGASTSSNAFHESRLEEKSLTWKTIDTTKASEKKKLLFDNEF